MFLHVPLFLFLIYLASFFMNAPEASPSQWLVR